MGLHHPPQGFSRPGQVFLAYHFIKGLGAYALGQWGYAHNISVPEGGGLPLPGMTCARLDGYSRHCQVKNERML